MRAGRPTRRVFRSCLNRRIGFRWRQPRETDLDWRVAVGFRFIGKSHLKSPERSAHRRELDRSHQRVAPYKTERSATSHPCLHGPDFYSTAGTIPPEICRQDMAGGGTDDLAFASAGAPGTGIPY